MGASKLVLHYKSQHRTGHTRGKGPGSVTVSQLFHGPAPRSPARFKLVIGNSLGAKVGIICRHTRGRAHELAPGRELVPASVAGSASCAWPKAFDEAHIAQHASPSMSSTISPRFYSHGPTVFIVLQASMQARDGWAKGCLSIDSGQNLKAKGACKGVKRSILVHLSEKLFHARPRLSTFSRARATKFGFE